MTFWCWIPQISKDITSPKANWDVPCHAWFEQISTNSRASVRLSSGNCKKKWWLGKQQANDQRKIMDTTILIVESACKVYGSMFERELKAFYCSLNLSCLHMVLEEKSTADKFLSFQYMYKQLSKWGRLWWSKWRPTRHEHCLECKFLYMRWLG